MLGSVLPSLDPVELGRRVAVTAVAVLVYHAGSTLPLPGLDPNFLAKLAVTGGGASERLSILALGIAPFFSALLIVELVKAVVQMTGHWLEAADAHRAATGTFTVSLALVIALFQASGIAGVLDEMRDVVAAPGALFRLSSVLTLVAGAALMIWLADRVTRHGLGSGVWILLLFPVLLNLPYQLIAIYDLSERQGVALAEFTPAVLLFLGSVIAITAWYLTFSGVLGLDRAFLWPTVWAFAALPWCLVGVKYLQGAADQGWRGALLDAGHPLRQLLLALLLALFSLISLRVALNQHRALSPAATTGAALLATVTLVVVALAGDYLDAQMPVPMPVSARDILLLVVVALSVLSPSGSRTSP